MERPKGTDRHHGVREFFIAGCASGATTSLIEAPVALLKCQLQMQYRLSDQPADGAASLVRAEGTTAAVRQARFTSLWDCLRGVIRVGGLRGVFQGLGPTLWRNCPGQGAHFVVYELA